MFHMDRETKVFTVTPTSDVPLSGQRSKGQLYMAKILNNVRFCSGLLHLVWIDEQNEKVNHDNQVKGHYGFMTFTFSVMTTFT